MTVWFTSDTHFGHGNVIKYSNRPFASVEEMEYELIRRWNEVVKPGDTIYHLGDVAFISKPEPLVKIISQLKGQKHLVLGNHDNEKLFRSPEVARHWQTISHYKEIKVSDPEMDLGRKRIVLLHYAMKVWNQRHYGAWQLYGHSHGTLPDPKDSLQLDVGVDCHNYYPISYEQVKVLMAEKHNTVVDHHDDRR